MGLFKKAADLIENRYYKWKVPRILLYGKGEKGSITFYRGLRFHSNADISDIAKIGEKAIPILREMLGSDSKLRKAIEDRIIEALVLSGDTDYLLEISKDDERIKRKEVIAAFKKTGEVDGLIRMYDLVKESNEDDFSARCKVIQALEKMGDSSAIPTLAEELEKKNCSLRNNAASALGNIGDPAAIPMLIGSLDDSGIRNAVIEALAKFGTQAVPGLEKALKEGNKMAAIPIGKICGIDALPVLIECLRSGDQKLVKVSHHALIEMGEPVVGAVREVLEDGNKTSKIYAAMVIAKLGHEDGVEFFVDSLDHEDHYMRQRAAEALGKIKRKSTVPALIKKLHESGILPGSKELYDTREVTNSVIRALGEIGDRRAVPHIIKTIKEDNMIRNASVYALAEIEKKNPGSVNLEEVKERLRAVVNRSRREIRKMTARHCTENYINLSKAIGRGKLRMDMPELPAKLKRPKERRFRRRVAHV